MGTESPYAETHSRLPNSLAENSLGTFDRHPVEVWFEVCADSRPRHLLRRITMLTEPDFQVRDIDESARIEDPGGSYRAHWHCCCAPRRVVDEFAALRLLKRLTGAGFRILRFDNVP